jgi:hypothetical protein
MKLWLLIALVCVVQEFASTNAVLITAYRDGYPLLAIHALYAAGTIIDFFAGYWLGAWVHRRSAGSRWAKWADDFVQTYVARLGAIGKRYLLFVIGALNFTYMDAFIVPWVGVSWLEAFVIFFCANALWYAFQWAFILGVNLFFPSPLDALFAVVAVSLVVVVVWKLGSKKIFGRW